MEIRQQLVSSRSKTYGGVNPVDFITIHETANRSVGAGAQAHANLQSKGNVRNASWHWQVDDSVAIQSFLHTVQCWHAGDGRGAGNLRSVAIEICVNAGIDQLQAYRNAAELVRYIMANEAGAETPVQHNHWSGKNCPALLRSGSAGLDWSGFLALVNGAPVPVPPPVTPVPAPPKGDLMSQLPNLDWRTTTTAYDAMTERVQGLLKAADCYTGGLDGRRGPLTVGGLAQFQIRYNCGNGRGGADKRIGGKTWESLLFWKKW